MKKNPYKLPADTRSFIPHRDAMLLIDSLDIAEADTGKASAVIRRDSIFYEPDRGLNPVAFVEFIAQAAAAHHGYTDMTHGRSIRPGFLVAVKDFHIDGSVTEGDKLQIHIKRILEINNATVLNGSIRSESDVTIAAGTLNLWILDETLPSISEGSGRIPIAGDTIPAGNKLGKNRDIVGSYIINHIRITKWEENRLSGGICFREDFSGFDGHFPGSPILPGIVTLHTATVSTEILLKNRIRMHRIEKTKFMQPAMPDEWINIECRIHQDGKGQHSRVEFSTEDKKIASVMIRFEEI